MILFLLLLNQLDFSVANNYTSDSFLEPEEYYLIILGILVGTLIFMFLAFAIFYLSNNKKFREIQRRMSDYHTSRNYLYQTDYDLSPYLQPTIVNRETQYSTRTNPLFDEEENISTSSFVEHIENEPIKLEDNNFCFYREENNLLKNKYIDNISVSSDEVFEGFDEIKNILEHKFTPKIDKKDEYIEIKPKKNSLKKRHSTSSITNTKNNLMDELRKNLPNLVPKNMLDY
jgi:hypothetical protein